MAAVSIRVSHGARTDVGLKRQRNEDALLATWPAYLVADGMGGHGNGDVASALVIEAMSSLAAVRKATPEQVRRLVHDARSALERLVSDRERPAGTTLAGAVIVEQGGAPYWFIVNIGDSRVYRAAPDGLTQISVDHSEVQERLDRGELDKESAAVYSRRNVVTRALGAGGHFEPEYWLLPLRTRDRLLICTDGLTRDLDDATLASILAAAPSPEVAAEVLVDAALAAGGHDNVSVIVVDVCVDGAATELDQTNPLGAHGREAMMQEGTG